MINLEGFRPHKKAPNRKRNLGLFGLRVQFLTVNKTVNNKIVLTLLRFLEDRGCKSVKKPPDKGGIFGNKWQKNKVVFKSGTL